MSEDLSDEFPEIRGFSISNLKYIRQWYLFYNEEHIISQQVVGQFGKQLVDQIKNTEFLHQLVIQIPWGHNILIISKCKSIEESNVFKKTNIFKIIKQ